MPERQIVWGIEVKVDGVTPPSTWPSVSLCMIVKNEEDNLAECLAQMGDFAREMIVVDTGSTDRTVEIAQQCGARVEHFPWINDFAAARNESIQYATGDWVLWMDADDRISAENLIRLKQVLVSGKADVYMCRIVSPGPKRQSGDAIVEHLRLFKNHLGLYFKGVLHESIMESVTERQLVLARTNVSIQHTGYNIEVEEFKAKANRNLAIINRQLEMNPGDIYWQYHRAAGLTILGQMDEAIKDYEAVVANPVPELHWEIYVYQAHTALVHLYFDLNRYDDVQRILAIAFERFPQRRHLAILAGIVYMNVDDLEAALASLQRAGQLAAASDVVGQVWPEGKLEQTLGQVYVMLGQLANAHRVYRQMLVEMGLTLQLTPPPELAEAKSLVQADKSEEAATLITPFLDGCPDALRLMAVMQNRREQWRSAATCLAQAIGLDAPRPGDWLTLAEYFLHTRHFETTRRLCNLALEQNNENTRAMAMLGFVAIQQNDAQTAMMYLVQALFADPAQEWARQNLESLAKMLELTVPEAVSQYGTTMLQQRQYAFAVTAFALLVQLQPRNPQPYKSLAVALNALGREAEALEAWQTAQMLT